MDSSNYSTKKILSWVILIGTMLLSALSWFLDLSPYLPSTDWRWYAVIFTALFFGTSIYRIINLENIIFLKTPRIILHEPAHVTSIPFSEVRWFVFHDTIMNYQIAKISFANNPNINTELNHANGLNAQLFYKDVEGNILVGPIYGHWSNSDGPRNKEDALNNRLIYENLDSSGVPKSIYLAIKNLSSKSCYAFSDLSYFEGFENQTFCLDSNVIDLVIILKGERVKEVFKCRIYNDGENFPLRIEMRKTWIKKIFSKKNKMIII